MSPARDIRCSCAHRPLLARYGRTVKGDLFIWAKVYKQGRLFGEIIVSGDAVVRLRCRNCYRWFNVRIRQPHGVRVHQEELPPPLVLATSG